MIFISSATFIFSLFYCFFPFPPFMKKIGKRLEEGRERNRKIENMLLIPVLIMILLILVAQKVSE
jgi:hypothetical protein